jgi:pyruvate, orthophosphate dikinase
MTYGLSRDDAGKILDAYYKAKIFESDPTARLDLVGVGKLMKIATEGGVQPARHQARHLRRARR